MKDQLVECVFCEENLKASASPFDRIVASSETARIVPALGMMVPGYFLALTNRHVEAVANLDIDEAVPMYRWLERLTDIWAVRFGEYVMVEHGSCPGVKTGSCITHAHVHLVPMGETLASRLLDSEAVVWQRINDVRKLGELRGQGYVSLKTKSGVWASSRISLPSQWLRQQMAEHLGREIWDWALEAGWAQLESTLAHLTTEDLSDCA